jgi:glycosyltransferase involved in cell wall biosynthesis
MNIGLNAIGFVPGRMGGVESYFRNLLFNLQRVDKSDNFIILCNRIYAKEFNFFNPPFRLESYNYSQPSLPWLLRGGLKNIMGFDPLAPRINRLHLDVVHHPFTVLDPMHLKAPSVLTFWDMQQEFFPEYFTSWQLYIRGKTYKKSAELAKRIIVSSIFTKNCLVEYYGIDGNKIDVIYIGYGQNYKEISDVSILDLVKNKFSLDAPFLFYPAAAWPHKNHRNLLSAFKILLGVQGFEGKLVLTGVPVAGTADLSSTIRRLGLQEHVRSLGYVPSEELPALYNLARMMVFPSLFEGFGIPIIEAMACGCPVACSNTTSLPEIVRDHGILFDPNSPPDMAEKIWAAWNDETLLENFRNKGMERVREFDWATAAEKTVAVYRMAL